MKQTRKDLKELAKSLGAYYCGGNVYNHENIQHYLERGNFEEVKKYASSNNDILETRRAVCRMRPWWRMRKVRATQSASLSNGKLSARANQCRRK